MVVHSRTVQAREDYPMPTPPKAPWLQRVGVAFFTAFTGILVFWLLGFLVGDIGQIEGPQQADVEARILNQRLVRQEKGVEKQLADLGTQIETLRGSQALLRD